MSNKQEYLESLKNDEKCDSEKKMITTSYPKITISNVQLEKVKPAEYLATMSNNLKKFLSEINKNFDYVTFETEGTEELVDNAKRWLSSEFKVIMRSVDDKFTFDFITCKFDLDMVSRDKSGEGLYDITIISCEPLPVSILPYWVRMKLLRDLRNIIFKEINNMIVY